jgi:hypothetical protein
MMTTGKIPGVIEVQMNPQGNRELVQMGSPGEAATDEGVTTLSVTSWSNNFSPRIDVSL